MESTKPLISTPSSIAPGKNIHSTDLLSTLAYYADKIKILSLDCFDTILWRKTATPSDAFYDLQQKPTFQEIGLNAMLRARIESQARSLKAIQHKSTEVTLRKIYQSGFPNLTEKQINALMEEELATEIETCYAFLPIIELMRAAKTYGIRIIIVSNTYLEEPQLRQLLKAHLPEDVIDSIERIFCSCENKRSKNNGLFKTVLEKMACEPNTILHIGDDLNADLNAANAFGLNAHQLLHFDDQISELLRFHAASASLFSPTTRHTKPLNYPYRAILATAKINTAEQMIGYASIGPIMYAFAKFILASIEKLQNAGKKPKVLFLMRDAHLPALVCEALIDEPVGKCVRISRFSAFAASFRTKEDIDRYLSEVLFSGRFDDIARQLLLPKEVAEPLAQVALQARDPYGEFVDLIHRDDLQNIIFKMSKSYRKRLIRYLKKEAGLKANETLLFVDLGYTGTAQRQLQSVFKDELNVDIVGCYLLQLSVPDWQASRSGLLDPSWCDDRVLYSLVAYIALLEQICTSNEKSVIDYDEEGNPLFSETSVAKNQHLKVEKIQQECIRFVKEAAAFFKKMGEPTLQTLRETALSELARFVFLPTEGEVKHLESFQFDLNLGTHDILRVFDAEKGLASLRKRGLFFSFMEKNKKTFRTNYPAELRSAGLELVLTLMTQHRFGMELGYKEMSLRRDTINVTAIENNQVITASVEAILTYDGYYAITLPVSNHGFHTGVLLGQKYQWVQFESAEIFVMNSFLRGAESLHAEDYWEALIFNSMTDKGDKLFECHSTESAVIIPPLAKTDGKNYLIRLVYRPIVIRHRIS